jgi:xylulokinase
LCKPDLAGFDASKKRETLPGLRVDLEDKTMPKYIFAYDLGTTGVKAGILTGEGDLVGTAYREYGVIYPASQWVEQSVDEMWQAQQAASKAVFSKTGVRPGDIAAVAVSCQRATFVALDRAGQPLTNFIGWQDKRSIDQCETMRAQVGAERYYRIAGLPLDPTAAVSKILWLKEHAPDVFDQTATFASTQNIHLQQLGVEQAPCDLADAAYLGLLDVDRLQWSKELLDALGIPEDKMPRLTHSGRQVGVVSRAAAEATGLAAGTPVVAAGGDLQCSGLGIGVAEPGYVSVGIGTGGGVLVGVQQPLRHPDGGLNCLPHVVEGMWEVEGIALASGAAYKWFRDTLGIPEKEAAASLGLDAYEILNAEAARVAPGSGGVIVMPSLLGAGAPNWYPKARGLVLGLTPTTDKKALVRAMLEGICLEIRWMLEAAEKLGTHIAEVRIWGGAAKSPLWNQIAADVYGVPAASLQISDSGLVGAAICAGLGVGMFKNAPEGVRAMVHVAQRYEPNPAASARFNEMFAIYKEAYQALVKAGVFERLAALS